MFSSDLLAQCNYFASDSLLSLKKIKTEADKNAMKNGDMLPAIRFPNGNRRFPKSIPITSFILMSSM